MDFLYIQCSLNKPDDKSFQSEKATFLLQLLGALEDVNSPLVPP